MNLPDTHKKRPQIQISLEKVGVTGVKVPVASTSLGGKQVIIVPVFQMYVDLPAEQRGIHVSRSYDVMTEILHKYAGKPYDLEDICAEIAEELLERHPTATQAEARAVADAIVEKKTPQSRHATFESFKLGGRAKARRMNGDEMEVRRWVSIDVVGMTACPCSQGMLREVSRKELTNSMEMDDAEAEKILDHIPIGTHIQRGHGSITVELPEGSSLDALKLVEIAERSMSASTYEMLKRVDEAELVRGALAHPRFVEDCIRFMMRGMIKEFPELDGNARMVFRQRNEESIHKHDIVAERRISLAELRREMRRNHQ